jgi:SAM-dependent methyltransferase
VLANERLAPTELAKVHFVVNDYYTKRLAKYGSTALGVDWICTPSQELRFVQLLKLCDFSRPFSMNDLGCGYGALLAYLSKRHAEAAIDYLGIDLSFSMIESAKSLWQKTFGAEFVVGHASSRIADYSLASGIFNVKLDQPVKLWERYIRKTLADMHSMSARGFAVNFMAVQEPNQVPQPNLYRTRPDMWVRYCERVLGCGTDIVENYGLREFTLLARQRDAM